MKRVWDAVGIGALAAWVVVGVAMVTGWPVGRVVVAVLGVIAVGCLVLIVWPTGGREGRR